MIENNSQLIELSMAEQADLNGGIIICCVTLGAVGIGAAAVGVGAVAAVGAGAVVGSVAFTAGVAVGVAYAWYNWRW